MGLDCRSKYTAVAEISVPGKVILFGEHAVVYGQPAIAIPVSQLRTRVVITEDVSSPVLDLPDLGTTVDITSAPHPDEEPLLAAVREVQAYLGMTQMPAMRVVLTSDIPIASGLGSGAAAACAIIRGLLGYFGEGAADEVVNRLVYNIEKLYHGTPSGIDNTVVTYEQPVYFMRKQPNNVIETFDVGAPLHLLIADTGVKSPTMLTVGDVRRQWKQERERFDTLFAACGQVARQARLAIERGDVARVGVLMGENQAILSEMGVSSAELDHLIRIALSAGALGAKLSGGGRGGNMIALTTEANRQSVADALREHSRNVLQTTLH